MSERDRIYVPFGEPIDMAALYAQNMAGINSQVELLEYYEAEMGYRGLIYVDNETYSAVKFDESTRHLAASVALRHCWGAEDPLPFTTDEVIKNSFASIAGILCYTEPLSDDETKVLQAIELIFALKPENKQVQNGIGCIVRQSILESDKAKNVISGVLAVLIETAKRNGIELEGPVGWDLESGILAVDAINSLQERIIAALNNHRKT